MIHVVYDDFPGQIRNVLACVALPRYLLWSKTYVKISHGKLRWSRDKVLKRKQSIVSSFFICVLVFWILIPGVSYDCGGLQKQQIRHIVPAVLIFSQVISWFVVVSNQVWSKFLEHSQQAGAARSSVKPNNEWCFFVSVSSLRVDEVEGTSLFGAVEESGVQDFLAHALNKGWKVQVGRQLFRPREWQSGAGWGGWR